MHLYLLGEILLTLYLYFISYFYTQTVPLTWTAPLRLLFFGVAVHVICDKLSKFSLIIRSEAPKKNWKFGLLLFGVPFVVLGVYYLAYYPGGLIIDTFNQWYRWTKDF